MASKIYWFSYKCGTSKEWTDQCITDRMDSLYDIKQLHNKSMDDVRLLERPLTGCFDQLLSRSI